MFYYHSHTTIYRSNWSIPNLYYIIKKIRCSQIAKEYDVFTDSSSYLFLDCEILKNQEHFYSIYTSLTVCAKVFFFHKLLSFCEYYYIYTNCKYIWASLFSIYKSLFCVGYSFSISLFLNVYIHESSILKVQQNMKSIIKILFCQNTRTPLTNKLAF